MRYTLSQPSRCTWPMDWHEQFRRNAPLLVEIGFGNADFLINLAKERPDANILGIEISLPSLHKGERKVENAAFTNVRLIKAKAESVFWLLLPPEIVQEIYINFPDPWPKIAHHHRRLINDQFLELAASRMKSGARLNIATDHDEYAAWISDCLSASTLFESRYGTESTSENYGQFRTKYSLKASKEGRDSRYFYWERNDKRVFDNYSIPKEHPMPHILLKSEMSLQQIAEIFEPWSYSVGGSSGHFTEIYQANTKPTLVIDTYVHEEFLDQRFLMAVTERAKGDFLVYHHEVGYPRPTTGLHRAVYELAQWLVSMSTTGKVLRSNLRIKE